MKQIVVMMGKMMRYLCILMLVDFVTKGFGIDIDDCLERSPNKEIKVLETLPGGGWDNLQNRNAGILTQFNYSLCRTTIDGKYLIPDNVNTIPKRSTEFEVFADVFEHWTNYISTTASTVNANTGINFGSWKLQGSFSSETKHVRERQMANNTATTRIQLRYTLYTVRLQPDAPLHETFKHRLLDIAKYIQSNKTKLVRYKSQLLVRDFGTHFLSSEDIGAALVQMDEVKKGFLQSTEKSLVKAAIGVSFQYKLNIQFGISARSAATKSIINRYLADRTHSVVFSHGGPMFTGTNNSYKEWVSGLADNVVAIDRTGEPIYYLITEKSLPELSPYTVYRLANSVRDAITAYYKVNTYFGCTKANWPNFSFQSNIDDDSCDSVYANYSFGGVYQTCERSGDASLSNLCNTLSQVNPMTGKHTCPKNYQSIPLVEGSRYNSRTTRKCFICKRKTLRGVYRYRAYWCAAYKHSQRESGFLFGGAYTSSLSNLLTRTKSCPKYFYPLKIGEDLHVCVSSDHELGIKSSAPFAGFFSCKAGNPLNFMSDSQSKNQSKRFLNSMTSFIEDSGSTDWPRACPKGYSKHLATIENGCEIQYCLFSHAVSGHVIPVIKRPPFMEVPKDEFIDNPAIPSDSSGKKEKQQNSVVTPVAVSVSVLLAAICIAVAIAVFVKRRKSREIMPQPFKESNSILPNKHVQYGTSDDDVTMT